MRLASCVGIDEVDDLLHRRAGQENPLHTGVFQPGDVLVGNDPADDDEHVVELLRLQQVHELRHDVIVRAR